MKLSVIITTYNSPAWLEKVLWGYYHQTFRDFELLLADDGSREDTAALIDRMRSETGMTMRHIWQRDDGFRKCRILNKAILCARTEYLVFTDGDCIPRSDFLAVHAREARPGRFLTGGYNKLPMGLSQAITREDIASGRAFDYDWLRAHGLPRDRKFLKLRTGPRRAWLLNRLTPAPRSWNGANSSGWLKDILRANGFDERMRWGMLDSEFGDRLRNAGITGRHLRYSAICIHLDHSRGYKSPEGFEANRAIRNHTQQQRITRTDHGITELLASGYVTAESGRSSCTGNADVASTN